MRYFTVDEANDLLSEIAPLVGRLLELRAKAAVDSREMGSLLADLHSDIGGPLATSLSGDFTEIEELVGRIQVHGCVIKSLEAGLVDFLAEIDGRDVFLCWRYNEPRVAYYHEIHAGYDGRRPLDR